MLDVLPIKVHMPDLVMANAQQTSTKCRWLIGEGKERPAHQFSGLQFMSPLGKVTYRAIDHQSTMGAYLGKTKLEGTKGVMTDYVYLDGAKYLPSDDEVKKLRPAD